MGDDYGGIRWYSPDPRCIFELNNFHVPKRLMRTYRQKDFTVGINTAWPEVLKQCSRRGTGEGVWISADIFEAYSLLNQLGFAHSVEVYMNDRLAGGLYGVALRGGFFGESMFHLERDASKLALIYLVERLKSRGYALLDTQFLTPHLSTFNATCIPKSEYLLRLQEALKVDCSFV
jgi:leucyl/phenylalanyl-tRNA--protein transferase